MSEFNIPFTTPGNYTTGSGILIGGGSASLSSSGADQSRISSSKSMYFDGSDDRLQFPSNFTASSDDSAQQNGLSFVTWAKNTTFANNEYIYAANDGGGWRVRMWWVSSTIFRFYLEGGSIHDPSIGASYDVSVSGLQNTWVHYACVLNISASKVEIYINGDKLEDTTYNPANPAHFTAGTTHYLSAGEGGSNITDLKLDEWMVLRRCITSGEVNEIMSGTFDYTDIDIIHHLSFENNLNDLSGFGRSMTTHGDPTYDVDVPALISGSVGEGITYPQNSPSIYVTTGNDYGGTSQPLTFIVNSGSLISGSHKFQISENGTLWQYYNTGSSAWESASIAPVDTNWNIEEVVNNNIHLFNTGSKLYVKTYLESDGITPHTIDDIIVTFFVGADPIIEVSASYYTRNLILTHL